MLPFEFELRICLARRCSKITCDTVSLQARSEQKVALNNRARQVRRSGSNLATGSRKPKLGCCRSLSNRLAGSKSLPTKRAASMDGAKM